ncbi:dihydrolipoamide acetyltransferase component of pyruvate dehydrogenase complex [Streptomyces filipinensis]|uniref:Dihydrolipoamide acetyltransferase component of pyruvate dehydrogenase complex n=1 Tax=Streptomyces filipinensis TaxID=66887 RepID=A0A918IDU0_9ACTN|nr:dihydrolipoamide acetyltransferase family protein [Streptomyces filipinensis]GGV00265.1 dihydrolipoamide acetyltransferase component of pyruvate dehydrogenase complex [Streptomyces filipinensis]
MTAFTMPSLGADMDEGLLQEWLVSPGERVHKGDVMAVVETDKAAIEVECFESGTVGRLLVEPGTRVPVGTPLALIEDQAVPDERAGVGEAMVSKAPTCATGGQEPATRHQRPAPRRKAARKPEVTPEPALAASRKEPTGEHVHAPPEPSGGADSVIGAGPLVRHLAVLRGVDLTTLHGTGPGGRITRADVEHAQPPLAPKVRASPYARRLAHDLGVDLAAVQGTGDGGAVRAADVRTAMRTLAGGKGPERTDRGPLTGDTLPDAAIRRDSRPEDRTDTMRRAIADLMSRSKREIPHYYLSTTIDLTAADDWLRRINRARTPTDRLVPAALLLKAAAVAAREVPALNGYWQNGEFVPASEINLGIAVSLRQGGLLAPVIHTADTLPPDALMTRLKELVQRARRGRLRGSEMTGATLTVTSLGDQGVEAVFGVIHPPQVALVGFGAVVERPWAAGGMLGVRPVVTATLAADHRATDGAVGARYLTAVDRLLQRPEEL